MSNTVSSYRLEQRFQQRVYLFSVFIFITAALLIIQIGNLQLLHGVENQNLARRFVSRQEFTTAPRGLIFDRHQDPANPLVHNIHYVDFVIQPSRFRNREDGLQYLQTFAGIMGRSFSEYSDLLEPDRWARAVRQNEQITLIHRLSRSEHERLAELPQLSRKGDFVTGHLRHYSMGPALAHVTGYIGRPTRSELDRGLALSYQMLGKGGIEARYDTELRGTDGVRMRHRIIDSEEQIAESEQGSIVVLNIDRDIQAAAYRALLNSGRRGTAIAIRPTTGEVLALVSHPSYDPNILSSGSSRQRTDHFERVVEHQGFLNLAIQTKFPPASTFKPLVALAALETPGRGIPDENVTYSCPGRWRLQSTMPGVPPTDYHCHVRHGHGRQNLIDAIANSCNVYFYQLGYRLGPTPIIEYAKAMGMDQITGIDLPGESSGFIPDQRWKQITWSSRWYDGDTINLSIGQGFLETTPMELLALYSGLVTDGRIYRPQILREVQDPINNRSIRKTQPELLRRVAASAESYALIRQGMRKVVTHGTARSLNRPHLPPIAGKTGTAQTRSGLGHRGTSHAWFAGYAPYGAPPDETIVVAVFVEYGFAGSASAAPVAAAMFEAAYPDYEPEAQMPGTGVLPDLPIERPLGPEIPSEASENNSRPQIIP